MDSSPHHPHPGGDVSKRTGWPKLWAWAVVDDTDSFDSAFVERGTAEHHRQKLARHFPHISWRLRRARVELYQEAE